MQARNLSSERIEFRSIEEAQVADIHKYQNSELREELSQFLDFEQSWASMSLAQIKDKVDEIRKEDRTALFGIWSKENEFVGLGYFSAGWDTWESHISVIIWSQHRRKQYGSEAAQLLLKAAFDHGITHVVSCYVLEWNTAGLAFAESLGFKRQGVKRRAGIINGKFFDGVFFDMLHNEYLALRSQGVDD